MTARIGLPPDAQGFKVLGSDGIWSPVTGTQQVENLVTNPSFESVQPGSTVLRTNHILNPSLEYSSTNWVNIGNASKTVESLTVSDARFGTKILRVTRNADTGSLGHGPLTDTLQPGHYKVGLWVRGTVTGTPYLYVEGSATRTVKYHNGGAPLDHVNWRLIWGVVEVTTTGNLKPGFLGGDGVGNYVEVDGGFCYACDASDRVDPSGDFFDGDTADELGWIYEWTGTPGSSTSVAKASAVETRRNYSINPSFRTGISGWSTGSGTLTWANSRAENTVAEGWSLSMYPTATIPAVEGEVWSARRTIGVPVGQPAQTLRLGLAWYKDGSSAAAVFSPTVTLQPGQEAEFITDGLIMPSLTIGTRAVIYRVGTVAPSGTIYVTKDLLERSSISGTHFDGSTSPSGDFSYAWIGAVDASASVQQGAAINSVIRTGKMLKAAIVSKEWKSTGNHSVRLIPGGSTISPESYVSDTLGTIMEQGKTYTALAKIRLTAPLTGTLRSESRAIQIRGNSGSVIAQSASAPNLAGEYALSISFTVPAGTTSPNVRLYHGGTEGSGDVWWDDFVIVEGAYTGPYFDGDTLPDVDYIYRWSGTPHASTSIGN